MPNPIVSPAVTRYDGGQVQEPAPVKHSSFADFWDDASSGFGEWWNTVNGSKALNQFNAQEAQKERDYNARQAELQRQYEERLSNSTYQRTVADMRAAGVNPAMLSGLTGGNLASTPSGSAASSSGASASSSAGSGVAKTILGAVALLLGRKLGASSKTVIINRK